MSVIEKEEKATVALRNHGTIFQLIPKIMLEIGAIEKSRKNVQQNYTFRGIDDFYASVQPIFAKYGVFSAPEVLSEAREERQTKSGNNLIYTLLKVRYTLYASDGSSVSAITVGEGMDSGDKSSNKALSSALKYALTQIFCVPTVEPKDVENDSHESSIATKITGRQANTVYKANSGAPIKNEGHPIEKTNKPVFNTAPEPSKTEFIPPTKKSEYTGPLSEAQKKRMYAIGKANNWLPEEIKRMVRDYCGKEHFIDLTREEYDYVCNFLEGKQSVASVPEMPDNYSAEAPH